MKKLIKVQSLELAAFYCDNSCCLRRKGSLSSICTCCSVTVRIKRQRTQTSMTRTKMKTFLLWINAFWKKNTLPKRNWRRTKSYIRHNDGISGSGAKLVLNHLNCELLNRKLINFWEEHWGKGNPRTSVNSFRTFIFVGFGLNSDGSTTDQWLYGIVLANFSTTGKSHRNINGLRSCWIAQQKDLRQVGNLRKKERITTQTEQWITSRKC